MNTSGTAFQRDKYHRLYSSKCMIIFLDETMPTVSNRLLFICLLRFTFCKTSHFMKLILVSPPQKRTRKINGFPLSLFQKIGSHLCFLWCVCFVLFATCWMPNEPVRIRFPAETAGGCHTRGAAPAGPWHTAGFCFPLFSIFNCLKWKYDQIAGWAFLKHTCRSTDAHCKLTVPTRCVVYTTFIIVLMTHAVRIGSVKEVSLCLNVESGDM